MHLLLVEDNDFLREEWAAWLEDEGHVVAQADSAEAAQALLMQRSFDVVISDVVLPGQSGLALARSLLTRQPQQALVLCSGHELAASALPAGARVRQVAKASLLEQLPALLAELAGGR